MRAANLCIICKGGRNLCGNSPCPLLPRFKVKPEIEQKVSKEFFGPSYNVFVGRMGYPNIGLGPLAAIEEKPYMDFPAGWFGMDYSKIIELRSLLLRSKERENIFSRSRFIGDVQLLAMSEKPADTEMLFRKKPSFRVSFSDMLQPMGPTAPLEKLKIVDNVRVEQKVERIVSDELKAYDAIYELYKGGVDIYKIMTLLSSGVLGLEQNRKIVPTRWSITSVQSMVADRLIDEIKQYPQINEYRVYSSEFLDNRFVILLMPGNWEFENFEAWAPGSFWASRLKETEILEEYEPFKGRTKYAEKQGGGFYSSRCGVAEGLHNLKRQAKVVVFREVYEGYVIPVGCWQILENVRNAFKQQYFKFSIKEEALRYIASKLRVPIKNYLVQSVILRQKRLQEFTGNT